MSVVQVDYPLVGGMPTMRLQCGNVADNPGVMVMIIPGNPGVAQYYEEFMTTMYEASGKSLPICCISHAGHGLVPNNSDSECKENFYSLEGQINHKLCYIRDHIPADTKLILIGHSIGCYMILHFLNVLESSQVEKCIMLFPTVERMAISPKGKSASPMLRYMRWMIPIPTYLAFSLIPHGIVEKMIRWYFKGRNAPECAVTSTTKLADSASLQNVTYLANQEMQTVVHADNDIIEKHMSKLLWYYGSNDHWCPVEYYEDMRNRFPQMEMFLCQKGYEHAFVLGDNVGMADFVWKWISENVPRYKQES